MGSCDMAVGLCVAVSLVLIYYFTVHVNEKGSVEALTTDQAAGNVPACLVPDWNPFAAADVRDTYLPERGWKSGNKESMWSGRREGLSNLDVHNSREGYCQQGKWDNQPSWSKSVGRCGAPLDHGDMRSAPEEVSTVNNNVRGADGRDNRESFSSQELSTVLTGRDSMWGRGESPSFWGPNPHLTMSGWRDSAKNVQEEFTSEQLYKSSRGNNAANY